MTYVEFESNSFPRDRSLVKKGSENDYAQINVLSELEQKVKLEEAAQ